MDRDEELFISDLPDSLSGGARPAQVTEPAGQPEDATTLAGGEEGDDPSWDGSVTTDALGEEGEQPGQEDNPTTLALGEEGEYTDPSWGGGGPGTVTTDAVGEEGEQQDEPIDVPIVPIDPGWGGGEHGTVTTDAVGEEGEQQDVPIDVPIDSGWGTGAPEATGDQPVELPEELIFVDPAWGDGENSGDGTDEPAEPAAQAGEEGGDETADPPEPLEAG